MKIRFSKKDPRAGVEVELDDFRAQELIDAGSAERIDAKAIPSAPENKAIHAAPENKAAKTKAKK